MNILPLEWEHNSCKMKKNHYKGVFIMRQEIAGIKIPDSKLAKDAADLLREHGNDLLWNHSNRVFLFGAVNGQKAKQNYDLELLYVSALFHDMGLTKKYNSL